MKAEDMIWEFLPKGLKGVFEIVRVERSGTAFHVWMDEIRQKAYEDRKNLQIVGKGYTDYCTIQDMPVRGLPTLLHMRKWKWLDKDTGEIFSYDIDYEDEEGTRLSAEFVAFLKVHDPRCGNETQRTDAFAACRKREVSIFNGNAYLCSRQARKSDA